MANFTNTKINQTFQRVVQVNGNAELQDGLGRQLSGSMGDLTVNGTLGITGYSDVSASLAQLHTFSSSLDNTFATDNELAAVSSSLALETAQLLNFSASLDATFATDAELSSLSSSVSATYLSEDEWTFHSASIRNDIFADSVRIAFFENKTLVSGSSQIDLTQTTNYSAISSSIADLQNFSASLDATFATDAELSALSSSVASTYLSNDEWTFHSASIRNDIFADSVRIAFFENKTLVSGSSQINLSQATGIAAQAITASYAISASHEITYELSSSYANFATTASHALNVPDISAVNAYTSSIDARVISLETLSSSLDTLFLSEEEWTFHSASIRNDIAFDSSRIAVLENKTLVSSSAQITDFGFISSSHTDIAALNLFTGSIQAEVNSLNAATSSFLTSLTANTLDELADVNDYNASTITDGYRLAWDSGSQEWAPAPSSTFKGTTRLFISTTRSNSSTFFFNSITRTATDSPSPVADSAFLLTSALLSKVTIYLRNDAASANACTVEVFKNADGAGFASASSIATDSGTLNTDVITTFSFTGLSLAQFDSIHIKVTPTIAGGQYYGIVIIE